MNAIEQDENTKASGNYLPNISVESGLVLDSEAERLAKTANCFLDGIRGIRVFSGAFVDTPPSLQVLGQSMDERLADESMMRRLFKEMNELLKTSTDKTMDPEERDEECEIHAEMIEMMTEDTQERFKIKGKSTVLKIAEPQDLVIAVAKLAGTIQHDLGNAMQGLNASMTFGRLFQEGNMGASELDEFYKEVCLTYDGINEYTRDAVPTILGIEFVHSPMTPTYAASLLYTNLSSYLGNRGIEFNLKWPGANFDDVMIDYPGYLFRPYVKNVAYNAGDAYELLKQERKDRGQVGKFEPKVTSEFLFPANADFVLPPWVILNKDRRYLYIAVSDNAVGYPLRTIERGFTKGFSGFKLAGIEPTGGQGLGLAEQQDVAKMGDSAIIPLNKRDTRGAVTVLAVPYLE